MQREEIQKYFQTYRLKHLTDLNDSQRSALKSFCVNSYGSNLLEYLQTDAFKENKEKTNKTEASSECVSKSGGYVNLNIGLQEKSTKTEA